MYQSCEPVDELFSTPASIKPLLSASQTARPRKPIHLCEVSGCRLPPATDTPKTVQPAVASLSAQAINFPSGDQDGPPSTPLVRPRRVARMRASLPSEFAIIKTALSGSLRTKANCFPSGENVTGLL